VDRRVLAAEREIEPGLTLAVSTTSGYSVHRGADYIGWIHASVGDRWQAYVRVPGGLGRHLGKLRQDDAVRAIARAWDDEVGARHSGTS